MSPGSIIAAVLVSQVLALLLGLAVAGVAAWVLFAYA